MTEEAEARPWEGFYLGARREAAAIRVALQSTGEAAGGGDPDT